MPTRIVRSSATRALVTALALALLVGCSAGGAATEEPTPSVTGTTTPIAPSASPSASPSPSLTLPPAPKAPKKPKAMKRDDIKGAVAAAKYYTQLVDYAWVSNQYSALEEMSDPDCAFCKATISEAKEETRLQRRTVNEGFKIGETRQEDTWSENRHVFMVEIQVETSPWIRYDKSGAIVERDDRHTSGIFTYNLYRKDGRWVVMIVSPSIQGNQ